MMDPGRSNIEIQGEDACVECGCTDSAACPGGCYWVAPGLCSSCAPDPQAEGLVDEHGAWTPKVFEILDRVR
jgi:hypothetical protein